MKEMFKKYFPIVGFILMLGIAGYQTYTIIKMLGTVGLMIVTLFLVMIYFNLYLFSFMADYLHDYISNQNRINFNNIKLFSSLFYIMGLGFRTRDKSEQEEES